MSIKVIGKIVLYEPLDQSKMDALLAGSDTIVLEIERKYILGQVPELLGAVLPVQFTDVSIDYITALKNVFDASSFVHEENALVFNVQYNAAIKEFDLTSSYVRTLRDTSLPGTVIPTGQILLAVFTTPGLDAPVKTVIELPYNQIIDLASISIIKDLGISLDRFSTGSNLIVTSHLVPYRVDFIQPESSIETYIIDFNYKNKTIEL